MGDVAELIFEGFICQHCGDYLDGDDPGHPRSCSVCENKSYWNSKIKKLKGEM